MDEATKEKLWSAEPRLLYDSPEGLAWLQARREVLKAEQSLKSFPPGVNSEMSQNLANDFQSKMVLEDAAAKEFHAFLSRQSSVAGPTNPMDSVTLPYALA